MSNMHFCSTTYNVDPHYSIHVLANVSRHIRQELITTCQCHLDDTCSRTLEIMVPFFALHSNVSL